MPATEETLNTAERRLKLGDVGSSSPRNLEGNKSYEEDEEMEVMPKKLQSESAERNINEDFCSLPCKDLHEKFFRDLFEILLTDAVFEGTSRKNRVTEWKDPQDLLRGLELTLPEDGSTHKSLLYLTKQIIRYSVKTGHPRFVNQLFSSLDPYGLAGQWLTDALNPSVYTYEVAPVFSLMEEQVLLEMRRLVGWTDSEGEGIFCPGGSIANGYAINLARFHRFPEIKETGNFRRLVIFTSEDAHYSIEKMASYLGLGSRNVYKVKTDGRGKMSVVDLELGIQEVLKDDAEPLMVSATAGTTVLGAYDLLQQISAICKKYNMWMHVDAAWGGGALFSRKHKTLLDGIHMADSVTWNPHKLLAAPQQCSMLLIRHLGLLQAAHGACASYLFQRDKFYDSKLVDSGDKHVQCGRRADVLKFFIMWKAKGSRGFEKHVDRLFELSRYFLNHIKTREGFKLVLEEPECTNICFWYVPPSMRRLRNQETIEALKNVAPVVKERMMKKGSMMMTYQPLREKPNFFRLVLQNSGVNEEDVRFFAEEIETLAQDL